MFAIQFLPYFELHIYFIKGISSHLPNQISYSTTKINQLILMTAYNHLLIFFKTLKIVEGTLNIEAGLMAGMETNRQGRQ